MFLSPLVGRRAFGSGRCDCNSFSSAAARAESQAPLREVDKPSAGHDPGWVRRHHVATKMIARRSSRWTSTKWISVASPASVTVICGVCTDRNAAITSASDVARAWRHFAQHVGQRARWFSPASQEGRRIRYFSAGPADRTNHRAVKSARPWTFSGRKRPFRATAAFAASTSGTKRTTARS
jgi:hypothetical protein